MSKQYARTVVVNEGVLRRCLREHYLAGIECDHVMRTDKASCACSAVNLPVCSTVGGAVQTWIDHVVEVVVQEAKA